MALVQSYIDIDKGQLTEILSNISAPGVQTVYKNMCKKAD